MAKNKRPPETNQVPQTGPTILTEPQIPPKPSRRTRTINRLIVLALVIAAAIIGVFGYWATQDTEVLKVRTQPFPTRTIREHPTAGGVVFLAVDYCKQYNVDGRLGVSFVSASREILLPTTEEDSNEGCVSREIPVLIPKDIAPDEYVIKLQTTYDVNPLKQGVTDTFLSEPFIIDPTTEENQLPEGSLPSEE